MKLIKIISIIITIIVFSVFICLILLSCKLNYQQKLSNSITLFTCYIAVLSLAFVIYNYLHSLEPSLLIQVINDNNNHDITYIRYANMTKNTFFDLSVHCKIISENKEFNYSNLFSEKMYMGACDERTLKCNFFEKLKNEGFDIKEEVKSGKKIILSLSFSYTFNNEKKKYSVQKYIYKIDEGGWNIM